ncbi:unnamed protein product [Angiostrongylus costaricensis]|uniref:FAD_binding_3 domain-containing protein n=1 Tax=Angiostrongylus costaricensis TaxID=334426 RepID=A0A0R3PKN6_ANGCS|nr:unnamed protein product [Angiostrongylus costaricensis]
MIWCRSLHFGSTRCASTSQYFDVVVVGGGLVGNAMACIIGQNPQLSSKRVLLLEGGKVNSLPSIPPEHYSNQLGVWKRIKSYRAKKVNKLRVIDNCSKAELEFDRPSKDQEIAYIVENNAIIGALYDKIKQSCSSVEVRTGVTVKNCIGADGGRSTVRQALNANYTAYNYDQSGVVATLVVEAADDNDIAWQRFFRAGPIAYLPLAKNLSSLVWCTSAEEAERLLSLAKDEFFTEEDQIDCVNKTLFAFSKIPLVAKKLGPTPQPPHVIALQGDTRAAFPLGLRCALIGDAAHRTHPLGGQGVNLGWNDVAVLNRILARAALDGADLGALTYLRDYDTQAQRHNIPVMVSCDWLNRLYRTNAAPIVMLRSLGLAAFHRLTPVKV